MTDASDGPGSAPAAAPLAVPQPAQVLAKGHLHPAILLLHLVATVRQTVVWLLLGLIVERWLLVVAIGLFLTNLAYALARYLTLEYTLTSEELRIREGILERQERRIPLDRIQDLGFESTILRRVLGLVVVLVETASGRGVEARLDALSRADADHLREVLLAARLATTTSEREPARAAPATGAATAPTPPAPEWLVHRTTAAELLLRGMTDLRLSAFVVTGFAALQLADQFGFAVRLRGIAGTFEHWLGQFPPLWIAGILVAILLAVMAFGVVTATLGNFVQFHGFVLQLRGDVLLRRYGLLTTRQKTLPRARIQRVTIEQPWLRRLLGLAVVKADSAGGSRAQGEDNAGGWDVVVPLTRLPVADALLPALLPGIEHATFGWQRGSPRLVLRTALQGVLLAGLGTPALWPWAGPAALLALLLVPLWALLGVLVWRNLGFALGGEFFALRHGVVGRYFAYVPTAKVQAVVVQQGPIAQLLGLAELTVYVAGGSPTRLPDLMLGDARRISAEIGARAAAAAARDW
ncbi:MAG TPA: PH domain-containing protein [Planctomycetota bacterium]|nr:PH domain-containing protein [Planctomycetota bacterium]